MKDINVYFKKTHEFNDLDFSHFNKYIEKEQSTSLLHKTKKKTEKINELFAIVDGVKHKLDNCMIEPPNVFIGRGNHPYIGRIKRRIIPEDITINISDKNEVVELPIQYKSHKWHSIIGNKNVEWLCCWTDPLSLKKKYIYLSQSGDKRTLHDKTKYDVAIKLGSKIKEIRRNYMNLLNGSNMKNQQLGLCVYFIDMFALRIGNEKDTEKSADTVGVTSLKINNVSFQNDNTIILDFLGKDSMRYYNKIKIDDVVFKTLQSHSINKSKHDQIFDLVNSNDVNVYLKSILSDLTAKTFRTYNAGHLFKKELDQLPTDTQSLMINNIKLIYYKVAKLCNHQKSTSTGKDKSEQIKEIKHKIQDIKHNIKKTTDEKKKIALNGKLSGLYNKLMVLSEFDSLAINTGKLNYIDPRIIISFCKKHNIDVGNFLSKKMIDRFKWATDDVDTVLNY